MELQINIVILGGSLCTQPSLPQISGFRTFRSCFISPPAIISNSPLRSASRARNGSPWQSSRWSWKVASTNDGIPSSLVGRFHAQIPIENGWFRGSPTLGNLKSSQSSYKSFKIPWHPMSQSPPGFSPWVAHETPSGASNLPRSSIQSRRSARSAARDASRALSKGAPRLAFSVCGMKHGLKKETKIMLMNLIKANV